MANLRIAIWTFAGLMAPGAASAQAWEWRAGAGFGAVIAAHDVDGGADPQSVAARLDLDIEAARTLDSGLELSAALAIAAKADHFNAFPRGGPVSGRAAHAPVSGLGGKPGPEGRAGLEAAYVGVTGPWGEAALGVDQGAAERFSLDPPSVRALTALSGARLDPSGLRGFQVRNDLSARGAKFTLISPRYFGARLGGSYTPGDARRGLDAGFEEGPARAENVKEAALSFSRTWGRGLRTDASLTYARGALSRSGDGISTMGVGVGAELGSVQIGASALVADGPSGGDYDAAGLGAVWSFDPWALGVEAAQLEDDGAGVSQEGVGFAVGRHVGKGLQVALAVDRVARKVDTGARERVFAVTLETRFRR